MNPQAPDPQSFYQWFLALNFVASTALLIVSLINRKTAQRRDVRMLGDVVEKPEFERVKDHIWAELRRHQDTFTEIRKEIGDMERRLNSAGEARSTALQSAISANFKESVATLRNMIGEQGDKKTP